MSDNLWELISPMYGYIICTVLVTMLCLFLIIIMIRIPLPGKMAVRFYSIFVGMSNISSISLGLALQKLVFVVYFIISRGNLSILHTIIFALLCILSVLFLPKGVKALLELFYSIFIYGGLFLYEYLVTYIREIRANTYIMIVSVLLGVVISLTALWFFLRELKQISESRIPKIEGFYEDMEAEGIE